MVSSAPALARDSGEPSIWHIHCDGTALPNPGRIGLGAVLCAPDGARHSLSTRSEHTGCNNTAEALALILALREAHARGARRLRVHSDSDVLVQHLAGTLRIRVASLATLFDEAATWLARFEQVELHWVPRHRNGEADTLARAALALPAKPAALPRGRRRARR